MSIFEILLNAIFTGAGVTTGAFLANRTLIKSIEKMLGFGKKPYSETRWYCSNCERVIYSDPGFFGFFFNKCPLCDSRLRRVE